MRLESAFGTFDLQRVPSEPNPTLRAWDAADEYLLNHISENDLDLDGRVLLVNDSFGALAVGLASHSPVSWSDSLNSHRALKANSARNNLTGPVPLPGTDWPTGPLDVVLIKVPKHNSLLEDQLHRLRPALTPNSVVIAAGMVKHIHTSTLNLFKSIIGPTHTSLAKKKARLAFVDFDPDLATAPNPWPLSWTHDGLEVVNNAGIFSARKLDLGTRLLLEHLPEVPERSHVVDLGCGNGMVGVSYMRQNPDARCTFVDESYAAVAAARQTVAANLGDLQAEFFVANTLGEVVEPETVDLVINNPPFHSDNALTTGTAIEMFKSSHIALRAGGELVVVANRHLGYHVKLKRIFGNCKVVASNSKFVVLQSRRD